jgi:hypothetical protein
MGKTTIACSLLVALEARGQLAASSFCAQTSLECRDASWIVSTIAYQLARHSTPLRSLLCDARAKNPDIESLNIVTQFERFIKESLLEESHSHLLAIVTL